eukprot:scaffold58121_cov74-Phaeocystis_antarctica.AAC.2
MSRCFESCLGIKSPSPIKSPSRQVSAPAPYQPQKTDSDRRATEEPAPSPIKSPSRPVSYAAAVRSPAPLPRTAPGLLEDDTGRALLVCHTGLESQTSRPDP